MAHHFPVPHQLNAARGCVGKSGLESLWRPRGASAQNTNQGTSHAGQSHPRRARRSSMAGVKATVIPELEIHASALSRSAVHAGAGVQDTETQDEPEIHDEPGPEPEMDDSGIPEPDVPEPDVPQPEIPEPEVPEPKRPEPEPSRIV